MGASCVNQLLGVPAQGECPDKAAQAFTLVYIRHRGMNSIIPKGLRGGDSKTGWRPQRVELANMLDSVRCVQTLRAMAPSISPHSLKNANLLAVTIWR